MTHPTDPCPSAPNQAADRADRADASRLSVRHTLVTGGVRSGKSALAEQLLLRAEGELAATSEAAAPTYVACGRQRDDADWAARVAAHRERRPVHWRTIESTDLPAVLGDLDGPALVDCLGTWLTARFDALAVWDAPLEAWVPAWEAEVAGLVAAWKACPHPLIAVTNEVGWGVVSEHRSGRLFADWLGRLNQSIADVSDRVVLVVAGQPLVVKGDPL